jgi:hypothetical protein
MCPTLLTTIVLGSLVATASGGTGLLCPADCNEDGSVDVADILSIISDWGMAGCDTNGDGVTGVAEILSCLDTYGDVCHRFHDNMTVSFDGEFAVVLGSGIPDHDYGNFPGECNNPNSVANQNDTWQIPLVPTPTNSPSVDLLNQMGPVAIAVNGVAIYNPYDAGGIDAPVTICFDDCNGHPSPDNRYHYHQYSPCIDWDEVDETGHSMIIGYGFDGYPIYGPWDEGGVYARDISGANALDDCNGHDDPVRGYHYHSISFDLDPDGFPWAMGCYHGEPEESNFQGDGGGGGPCPGCGDAMIPPPVCECTRNIAGYAYCCMNWDAACQAAAEKYCGGTP